MSGLRLPSDFENKYHGGSLTNGAFMNPINTYHEDECNTYYENERLERRGRSYRRLLVCAETHGFIIGLYMNDDGISRDQFVFDVVFYNGCVRLTFRDGKSKMYNKIISDIEADCYDLTETHVEQSLPFFEFVQRYADELGLNMVPNPIPYSEFNAECDGEFMQKHADGFTFVEELFEDTELPSIFEDILGYPYKRCEVILH